MMRVWSGINPQKVDQFSGQNVIFDILKPFAFQNIADIGSCNHFVFVFVFVIVWIVGGSPDKLTKGV